MAEGFDANNLSDAVSIEHLDDSWFLMEMKDKISVQDVGSWIQLNILKEPRHLPPFDLRLNPLPYCTVALVSEDDMRHGDLENLTDVDEFFKKEYCTAAWLSRPT